MSQKGGRSPWCVVSGSRSGGEVVDVIVAERVIDRAVVALWGLWGPGEPESVVKAWVALMLVGVDAAVGVGVGADLGPREGREKVDEGRKTTGIGKWGDPPIAGPPPSKSRFH